MSFVDAYSRFTWIYFLKNKSDALSVFKQFKSLVELQFNKKIKAIQTDWEGEFEFSLPLCQNWGSLIG